jgi:hypothetical protein
MAASILGAAISTVMLYHRLSYGLIYIMSVILSDTAQLGIMGICRSRAVTGLVYMNVIAFAYSKLNECMARLAGHGKSPLAALVIVAAVVVFTIINRKILSIRRTVYNVILKEKESICEAKALYDTGNLLTEPITGRPVSIIESNPIIQNWMDNTPEKYRAIPYKSIGNDYGMLDAMVIDQLVILQDNTKAVKDKPIIAIYNGKLSKDGGFNMILNHSLIE